MIRAWCIGAVLTVIAAAAAGSSSLGGATAQAAPGDICEAAWRTPGFEAFLTANPELRADDLEDQRRDFEARGAVEWNRLYARRWVTSLGGTLTPEDEETLLDEIGADERLRGLHLGDNSPLTYIGALLDIETLIDEGRTGEALQALDERTRWAIAAFGNGNAALIQVFALKARAQDAAGEAWLARSAADVSLRLIERFPERAQALSLTRVEMLQIRAQSRLALAGESGSESAKALAAQAQADLAEAEEVRRRYAASPLSGLLDIYAVLPGGQALAEHQSDMRARFADKTKAVAPVSMVRIWGSLLAAQPSYAPRSNRDPRLANGEAVVLSGLSCVDSAGTSLMAGDLQGADQQMAALTSLVNERNALSIIRFLADEDRARDFADSEALKAFDLDLNEAFVLRIQAALGIGAVRLIATGDLTAVAERVDRTVTPQVAGAGLKAVLDHQYYGDDDGDGGEGFKREARQMWRAVDATKVVMLALVRPIEPKDRRRLAEARTFLARDALPLVRRLAPAVEEAGFQLTQADLEDFANSESARLVDTAAPLLLDTLLWNDARAREDARELAARERSIYGGFESYVASQWPDLARAHRVNFQALADRRGSASQRTLDHLAPVVQSVGGRAFGQWTDAEGVDTIAEEPPVGRIAVAMLFSGVAGDVGDWSRVAAFWDPVAHWVTASAEPFDILNEERFYVDPSASPYLASSLRASASMLRRPLGDYIHALNALNREADAAALADLVLPAVRQIETQEGDEGELGRLIVTYAVPDEALSETVESLSRVGRHTDAALLARIRLRALKRQPGRAKYDFTPEVRAQYSRVVSDPYGQAVQVAYDAYVATNRAEYFDDMVDAFDRGRANATADAMTVLAALGGAETPAGRAFSAYLAAEARLAWTRRDVAYAAREGLGRANAEPNGGTRPAFEEMLEARRRFQAVGGEAAFQALNGELTRSDLSQALHANEVLIATLPAGRRVALLAVTRGGAKVGWSSMTRADMDRAAVAARRGMNVAYAGAPPPAELRTLYDAVIGPFAADVSAAQDILWAPHETLAEAPLSALTAPAPIDGSSAVIGLARGSSIVLHPRAFAARRALGSEAARPARAPGTRFSGLAIGDIGFTGAARSTLALTPSVDLMKLPATPWAAQSLRAFDAFTDGRPSLQGSGATIAALEAIPAQSVDYLLFHTHGVPVDRNGPGLVMRPGVQGSVLRAEDVLSLRFRPRYVLLAACSTGGGDRIGLEPYSGLVRAFLGLGASAVLTAQSEVDEAATTALLIRLYAHLDQGLAPAQALRRAQIDLTRDSATRDIRYWSQLVWVGDAGGRS